MRRAILLFAFGLWALPPFAQEFLGDLDCLTSDGHCVPVSTLRGEFVQDITVSGTTVTVEYQDSNSDSQSFNFQIGGTGGGSSDGVVSAGTFSASNQELTLTLTTGSPVVIDLSGLTTTAEVTSAISTALGDYSTTTEMDTAIEDGALQPGDITAGTNVTVTTTTDGVTIASSGGGTADGVVDGGSVSSTTLTLTRTVGADVTITGLPSGGGDSGLTAVSSDSTLDGDGTVDRSARPHRHRSEPARQRPRTARRDGGPEH